MFAGAAREVVFANPEVVRRINNEFIPVALKAGMVNNPPPGIEGKLYAEIGRSKPAPQGICTVNSDGKVLAWALSFDDDKSILDFLDHVRDRYRESPDATGPVAAERYMRFPGTRLDDIDDTRATLATTEAAHICPAGTVASPGTLTGRMIGRPLNTGGAPIPRSACQEEYVEATLTITPQQQAALLGAFEAADGDDFAVPTTFMRNILRQAYLGQLDASPLGDIPGSRNLHRQLSFTATMTEQDGERILLRIDGESHIEGESGKQMGFFDEPMWEHRVTLSWQGYVQVDAGKITRVSMLAEGDEDFRWGAPKAGFPEKADATQLMAGHAIDFAGPVRYGCILNIR